MTDHEFNGDKAVSVSNEIYFETRIMKEWGIYKVELSSYDRFDQETGPYKVINKDTGVIEYQAFIYPAAAEMAWKLEQAVINLNKEFDEQAAKDKAASVKENIKLVPKSH